MENRATVLFVDDEERILRSLRLLFRSRFQVLTTSDGHEAERLVRERPVHVIVCDQRMPVMEGIEVLRRVRQASPNTMRLLLTGYADLEAVVGSINDGEVFRYINKPWDGNELVATVEKAAEIALVLANTPLQEVTADTDPTVLVIDDDPRVTEMVRGVCAPGQTVHWRRDLDEAFALIAAEEIAIVVCDVRLGGRDISAAIKALKQHNPALLTIVQSPLRDVDMLGGLINQGQIYRFLPKPPRRGMLQMSLTSAGRHYASLRVVPEQRRRFQTEPVSETAAKGLSGRLLGYLDRMRQRAGA